MVASINSVSKSNSKSEVYVLKSLTNDVDSEANNQSRRSRRLWSVQGEPRSLLKRLRSQLAEDGCPESQLLLAKTLLSLNDENHEENCQQAVYWLIHASLQGNLEATQLLEDCFSNGIGIYEQNYEEVKICLKMDQQEKLARVAASHLFISLSSGNDWITLKMLQKHFEDVRLQNLVSPINKNKDVKSSKSVLDDLELRYGGERMSEGDLIQASQDYANGKLPSISINYDACLFYRQPFKYISIFYTQIIFHLYFIFCSMFLYKFSHYHWLIPVLVSILVGNYFNISELVVLSVYLLWGASFVAMCYSVVSILRFQRQQKYYCVWSCVLSHSCSELDTKFSLAKFKKQYIPLFFTYFGGLIIYLCMLPFIHPSVNCLTFPPLLLISFPLFFSLMESNALYNVLSSTMYIIAHNSFSLCNIKDGLLRLAPISKVIFNQEYYLFDMFYVNIDIASIFHGLWLVSLIFVGLTLGTRSIVGQLVNVTWFHAAILSHSYIGFQSSVFFSCFIWSFIVFLPYSFRLLRFSFPGLLVGLASLTSEGHIHLPILFVFLVSGLLFICSYFSSRIGSLLRLFVIIGSCISLLHHHNELSQGGASGSQLRWDNFQNSCIPSKDSLIAQLEHDCRPLRGSSVHWEGTVKQIEVESVSNVIESFLFFVPLSLHHRLKCLFGHRKPCSSKDDNLCQLMEATKTSHCSVDNWDSYNFKITVLMNSAFWKFGKETEIILKANNIFTQLLLQLSLNDKISFSGYLAEGIGTNMPHVHVSTLTCKHCQNGPLFASQQHSEINYDAFSLSLKSTFNFFCSPLLAI